MPSYFCDPRFVTTVGTKVWVHGWREAGIRNPPAFAIGLNTNVRSEKERTYELLPGINDMSEYW